LKNNPIARYALIGSAVVVAYFTIIYLADKSLFINPVWQWLSMIFYMACMYGAAREDCAQNGTNRDFRAILRTPFIVFLLINLAYWLFYYALNLADPALLQLQTQEQIAYIREQLEAGTGDPQQANTLREQLQYLENAGMSLPVGPVFMRMALGAIGGFGLSAAIAAILRR
jgi:hypothetical protein